MFVTTNRLVAGLFLCLLIGAACFSLERILFADASFILFRLINQGTLQIQEHRYGSFITQCVPLLASYFHLPLQIITVLYSASFNLFYLAVAMLLLYRFKEQGLAVLMAFYFTLFVSDTFFWMNNEVHQSIAWMFLFFGSLRWMGRKQTPWLLLPISALFLFFAVFTHPLTIFPTTYLWLFFITRKDWPYSRSFTAIFSFLLLALAILKWMLSTGSSSHYDVEKLQGVQHFSIRRLSEVFRSPFATEIIKRTVWNYWIVPVLFVVGMTHALRKQAYWQMALTTGFALIYFAALCLTFNDFVPFYTESELMPATIILSAPFVHYSLPQLNGKVQTVLLTTIFLVRLAYIGAGSPKWMERKEWVMETLETMRRQHITKAIIPENQEHKRKLLLTWGTPVESLIASALNGDKPQLTFVVDGPENLNNRMTPDNSYMILSFELIQSTSLNKSYFSFDTTASYKPLKQVEKP